jgi:Fe-S-cluster containining protein
VNSDDQLMDTVSSIIRGEMKAVGGSYGELSKGPVRRKLIPIYKRIDTLTGQSAIAVACSSGCDFCCNYHIDVTPIEVFGITEEVQSWTFARQEALLSRLKSYVINVRDLGAEVHRTTNMPCSFLHGGKCSIYPMRPLACRRHHSLDRSICERADKDPHTKEPSKVDAYRVAVSQAMEHLHLDYHRFCGRDRDAYAFHAALYESLGDRHCRERWNRGQPAFRTVADRVARSGTGF